MNYEIIQFYFLNSSIESIFIKIQVATIGRRKFVFKTIFFFDIPITHFNFKTIKHLFNIIIIRSFVSNVHLIWFYHESILLPLYVPICLPSIKPDIHLASESILVYTVHVRLRPLLALNLGVVYLAVKDIQQLNQSITNLL